MNIREVPQPAVPAPVSAAGKEGGRFGIDPYLDWLKAEGIPLTQCPEIPPICAEAALRDADVTDMTDFINQERAVYGLAEVAEPASTPDAWTLLQHERGAVLWLEARRLWDLRRWYADGTNDFLQGRATCMPFGQSELVSNPNLHAQ